MKNDFSIVQRQIITEFIRLYGNGCDNDRWSLKSVIAFFRMFFCQYRSHMGKDHPRLSNHTIRDCIEKIRFPGDGEDVIDELTDLDLETYSELMRRYFEQEFGSGCNYSIAHFLSGDIRKLRYYEMVCDET